MNNREQNREKILVVDDERSICQLVGQVLQSEGYEPIICTHPRDAIKVSELETFGLAFVDINLPEMTGLELASTLKVRDPMREIVFITGYGTLDIAVQAIKIGAYDYLRKPFSLSEIGLCLKRYQERQALRERIRLTEQRYFDLVQHIPLLIFEINRDFKLEFINNACRAMLGYDQKEALSTPNWFLGRIHPDENEQIQGLFRTAFKEGGSPLSIGCRLIHKEGQIIHAILKSLPFSDHEERPETQRLDGIIVDITDRVFLEKALVQKEKLKTLGAISAEVAHEIRNPLVSIGGFARRLQKKSPEFPESTIILRESQRLEKILDRIRNYLKPVELCHQQCSINAIINDSRELLSPEIERRGVHCQMNFDSDLPPVATDPDILTQIIINLIRNGIGAVEDGGELIVKTYESDQNIYIDFMNEIWGRKVKDPEFLFLPFDEGGQSIGLPLSYRLLKNLGGLLSFSQEKNRMIFTISLPKTGGHLLKEGIV